MLELGTRACSVKSYIINSGPCSVLIHEKCAGAKYHILPIVEKGVGAM